MLSDEKRIFTSIFKEVQFQESFDKLTKGELLTYQEKSYLLSISILFIKRFLNDKRYSTFADLAYYIVLKYSITYSDYTPLYDFSINFGFYPIAHKILETELRENNIIHQALEQILLDKYRDPSGAVLTLEQYNCSANFLSDESHEASYFAPTSFGKSMLIMEKIKQVIKEQNKIGIIVPTKSLLIQTLHMVRSSELKSKILTHDEMFNGEKSFIAIFTQERALRLLMKNNINFDILFIDEAHNILKKDSRSILLSRLLMLNSNRNAENKIYYFSPLVQDVENLKIKKEQNISSHSIRFNIKEPDIYELRLSDELFQYNRFSNNFYKLKNKIKWKNYVRYNSGDKNFFYNRRPIKIENLANKLCSIYPKVDTSSLNRIVSILQREIHNDFYGIENIKHGIVYIHGKLPDLLKEYLEFQFKVVPEIKCIVANTVILEGMNLPIDTLFIFNTRSLQGKELMNLIGRVNRLNTIFEPSGNTLMKLIPKIHFINNEEFNQRNSNMANKISLLRSKIFSDEVQNPILDTFDIEAERINEEEKQKILTIQENESFLSKNHDSLDDKLKAYLIQSGINEFYSNLSELIPRLIKVFDDISNESQELWSNFSIMDKIEYAFVRDIKNITDYELDRLSFPEARSYYENHILVTRKKSLKENIISLVSYFKERGRSEDPTLYFGPSYGEISRESSKYHTSLNKVYIDLSTKSEKELVNLAVVKLKMEDDFINYKLNKFITMLFDYEAIIPEEYNLYIYGTNNSKQIQLTKYGLSVSMVSRLESLDQLKNLEFDENNNLRANQSFREFLPSLDDFFQFEINRFIN